MNPKIEKNQRIQVFVRVRPLNKQEAHNVIAFNNKNNKEILVTYHGHTKNFIFDRVFKPSSEQIDVYKVVAEPIISEVIAGYNCTILAYGQTGTGKTYTMVGGTLESETSSTASSPSSSTSTVSCSTVSWMMEEPIGIIPRTVTHLFDELRVQQCDFSVRVSYLELYNEEIFDLLSDTDEPTKLRLFDDTMKKGSVIVQGLTEMTINSKDDVYRILDKGAEKRRIASTLMNANSSRSHTIFCVTVHTKENSIEGEDLLKTGKLYLVDLAGSENIKQSGATDMRAKEAFNINQALLTLGRCINKLTERASHVPYRESKLTRILQDSLGGRTKTTLIATISPAHCNVDESLNTLDYAFRAKSITNKPEINQCLSKKTLLKEYNEEIERLRKDLEAKIRGKGIYLPEERYLELNEQRQMCRNEISEKIQMIRMQQQEMDRKNYLLTELNFSLEQNKIVVETLETQLDEASSCISVISKQNQIKELIVQKYSETAEVLKSNAKELIAVADTSTSDTKKLHEKVDNLEDILKHNKKLSYQLISTFNLNMDGISDKLNNIQDLQYDFQKNLTSHLSNLENNFAAKKKITITLLGIHEQHLTQIRDIKSDFLKRKQNSNPTDTKTTVLTTSNSIIERLLQSHSDTKNKIQQLLPQVGLQDNLIVNLLEVFRSMISLYSEETIKRVGHIRKMINEFEVLAGKLSKLISELHNATDKHWRNYSKSAAEYTATVNEKCKIILEAMEYLESSNDNFFKIHNGHFINYTEIVNNFHGSNTELKEDFSNLIDSSKKTSETLISVYESTNKLNKDLVTKCENKRTEIKLKMDALKSDATSAIEHSFHSSTNAFREIADTSSSQINKQISRDDYNMSQFGNAIDILHSELDKDQSSLNSDSEDKFTHVLTNTNNLLNDSKGYEATYSQITSDAATELNDCRESFTELCTGNMREYKNTGGTPQRRFYKYPRTLVETNLSEKKFERNKIAESPLAFRVPFDDKENIGETESNISSSKSYSE